MSILSEVLRWPFIESHERLGDMFQLMMDNQTSLMVFTTRVCWLMYSFCKGKPISFLGDG